jgi:UDP-arabinose 4-epimerase
VSKLIFSSTCASYGIPIRLPIDEGHPQAPINPYGWSKFMIERMIEDFAKAYGLSAVMLRYFNAAGCDPEGEIGERHEPETHLVPLAINAALDRNRILTINGSDFETRDGTAIRDYVHVADLARAHVLAAEKMLCETGVHAYNLGTGIGTSVRELVDAVGRVSGARINVRYGPRRPGDPAVLVAARAKAEQQLQWVPRHSEISRIVETAFAWHRRRAAQNGALRKKSDNNIRQVEGNTRTERDVSDQARQHGHGPSGAPVT